MLTLPKIDRRGWLATWAQGRRRKRVRAAQGTSLPAPVLRAQYPTQIVWTWDFANPYKWRVYTSLDGGVTWIFSSDYWKWGADRLFAPDGGSELYYIVGVDAGGNEVTGHSNAVRPDDAPMPSLLLNDLLAYWKLDESSGVFHDTKETGVGIDLFDLGFDTVDRGHEGKLNSCAYNPMGYNSALSAAVGDLLDGGFSISFWMKSDTPNYFMLFTKAAPGYLGFLVAAQPGENEFGLCFVVYTGSTAADGGFNGIIAPDVCDGEWHHMVVVYTEDLISIYQDGVLQDSKVCNYPMAPAPVDLVLFNNSNMDSPYYGCLDEVGVWTRALSLTDVTQLYNNGAGRAYEAF